MTKWILFFTSLLCGLIATLIFTHAAQEDYHAGAATLPAFASIILGAVSLSLMIYDGYIREGK